MTPLRPLMQASVKPPSPLLTHEQQPLKPTTPLQPKNASKTPISHPQRRCRFHLRLALREQRRRRFHARDFQCPRAMAGPGRATGGRPTLQTSSNQRDSNRLTRTPVTNVVNPSPNTTIFSEKAVGLTTFATTGQKSTQKHLGLTTFVTTHTRAPQNHCTTSQTTLGVRRTRLRYPSAVARHGRASRRGAERSESLASRAAGPSGARNTRGATSNNTRRGRRAGGPSPTGAQSSPARRVRPSGARNTCGQANRPYSPPPGSGRPV